MLKIDEHENIISELITLLNVEGVDQAKVSTLLQNLRENYNDVDTTFTTNSSELEGLKETVSKFKSTNMDLLLKLGTQYKDLANKQTKNNDLEDKEKSNVMSFEELSKSFE